MYEDVVPGVVKGPQKRAEGLVILVGHDEKRMLASSKRCFILNHANPFSSRHKCVPAR